MLAQSTDESKQYLAKIDVKVDDFQQVPLSKLGAQGTPTLILVNASGVVVKTWEGLLPPEAENDVLNYVK